MDNSVLRTKKHASWIMRMGSVRTYARHLDTRGNTCIAHTYPDMFLLLEIFDFIDVLGGSIINTNKAVPNDETLS